MPWANEAGEGLNFVSFGCTFEAPLFSGEELQGN